MINLYPEVHLPLNMYGLTPAYLKQLDSDNSKHELKKAGDQDNVANSLYCDYHALDYVL
jgi:hypothetical protein